jgi:DNA repair protein RadC
MNVRLTKEQKIKVSNAHDIFEIMQKILKRENKIDRDKEHFWIIGLSAINRILFIELISLGTVSMSLVHPMEVFSFALQKRAVRLIIAHNHPSGELDPSIEDKDITNRLLQNSLFLEVPIIDHVIISETAHYSFAESGLLDELRQSKKYVTPYKQEEDRLRNEGIDIGFEKGKIEKAREMARELKAQNLEISIIVKVSGLSEDEIVKL